MIESVKFYSEGNLIFGNLHLPYENSPCVITLHGLESSKDGYKWPIIAEKLYGQGYACLRFNFRGCGEGSEKSEGEFANLTERIKDYKSALQFLQGANKVDMNRLGAVGSSFGGMVGIAAQDKRIRAIAILATPYKLREKARKVKKSFYKDLEKYDLLKAIKNAPPIMMIYGSLDEYVEHGYKLYENAREPKRIEIIEGADHILSQPEHLNRAIDLILEWFGEHL
ncbi:MAG: alpha/beta fold hydrolase [Candidatus Aenigmarchaeota archaeon]|nr:alpha/beta fold hydrolase [Candidatus Aenigmarchaeota archaeon]